MFREDRFDTRPLSPPTLRMDIDRWSHRSPLGPVRFIGSRVSESPASGTTEEHDGGQASSAAVVSPQDRNGLAKPGH